MGMQSNELRVIKSKLLSTQSLVRYNIRPKQKQTFMHGTEISKENKQVVSLFLMTYHAFYDLAKLIYYIYNTFN